MPATSAASSMGPETRVSRPMTNSGCAPAMAGQDGRGRAPDLHGEFGRELVAREAADAVGTEQGHEQPFSRWQGNPSMVCRRCGPGKRQCTNGGGPLSRPAAVTIVVRGAV